MTGTPTITPDGEVFDPDGFAIGRVYPATSHGLKGRWYFQGLFTTTSFQASNVPDTYDTPEAAAQALLDWGKPWGAS